MKGLTQVCAALAVVLVASDEGAGVHAGWTATVRNGVFGVVNPKPAGLLILFQ